MTTEYWSVDGESLDTYAYRIESWGGSRLSPPPVRGANVQIPYVPGTKFAPKLPDERVITLGMWIIGADPTTGAVPADAAEQFNENWDALIRLFYRPWEEYNLGKRWKIGGSLLAATGRASYHGGMDPEMWSRTGAHFAVDLKLCDPYFYDTTDVTTSLAVGVQDTINNAGHGILHKITVKLYGPLTNPTVTNDTYDVAFTYPDVLGVGEVLTLDVKEFTADIDGTPIGRVIDKSGAHLPFELYPGDNDVTLTADAGTGTADIIHRANYF